MKTTFWDSIVDFFKSISHKKPSGEPVNQNWEKNVTNQPKDPLTISNPITEETNKTNKTNAVAEIAIEPDPIDKPQEIELTRVSTCLRKGRWNHSLNSWQNLLQ